MEAETLAMAQEIDFSMWALFARATFIVKVVMLMLIVASFWAWSIIIQKWITYRKARREADVFDRRFWSGEPLDQLFEEIGPDPTGQSEKIFAAGMMEWRRSHRNDGGLIAGATARIDRSMDVAIAKESEEPAARVAGPGHRWLHGALRWAFRYGLGHHERLYRDCRTAKHQPGGGGTGDCRGASGHRAWPAGGDPGGDFLQQAECRQ